MTATILLWTLVVLKTASEVKIFEVLFTKRILFNQTQNSNSKLVRAKSHLNFFTKCLQKNVYPKHLDIKSEHFHIAFATDDIKESLGQLVQKTVTKKMSIYIPHLKLKVLKFEEDIATNRDKLRNICHKERLINSHES